MRVSRFVYSLIVTSILVTSQLWPQIATTSLRGVLIDPSGALVSGASLTLVRPDTGFTARMTSNPEGAYIFQQVAPGNYEPTVSHEGFANQTAEVRLLVNHLRLSMSH